MFDDVNFKMDCPECGNPLNNFQSKDGPCSLYLISVSEVCVFYDRCSKCGAWVEFIRKFDDSHKTTPTLKEVQKQFDMFVNDKKLKLK